MKTILRSAALVAASLALFHAAAHAADVETIKKRGTLVVGVKADYRPFGYRDPSGAVVGIEPNLAADVAKRLGVKLELVPVVSSNRIEFLQQGKVDMLIATLSDTPERRKVVQGIDPPYYSDFVNVMVPKKANLKNWSELKGRKLCGTSGAWYNRNIARDYGAEIAAFDGSEKPLFALKQGNCAGYVYDQTFLQGRLLEAEWNADYAMPLDGVLPAPWMMAVAPGNDSLKTFLEATTRDWMKTGLIVEQEKKYGIKPTEYSLTMHEKMKGASN